MNLAKIGVISPYPEFTDIVMEAARDYNLNVIVREEILDKVTAKVREWEIEDQVEIMVARGAIAASLKKKAKVPVVAIEISSFDIIEAVHRAQKAGGNIALINYGHHPPRFDYHIISEMLGIDFQIFSYQSKEELQQILEQISFLKNGIVVGSDVSVVRLAGTYALKSVLVHSSREFIQDALEKAKDVCLVRRKDLRLCKSFQAILNNVYDGIMAVENGVVTVFNPAAEKTTGLAAAEALGRPVEKICRNNAICRGLYGDGKNVSGRILDIAGLSLVINRVQDNSGLLITFQAANKIRRMGAKTGQQLHSRRLVAKFRFGDIVGRSAMIEETIREARKYAHSEAAVLITGESGTGKELFAQSIHNESNRKDGPFVAVNCAALPENLLESELFGYEDGAFTGARKGGRQGLFSLAHNGTIFLDEVGELSPGLQARLLRVLQEKEIMPVGGQRIIPVDVRVISATNQNLTRAVKEGRFREDLYFRLNILNLQVPPLRDRLEDIPGLFIYFLERLAGPGAAEKLNISNKLPESLKKYMWPGNVRELEGFVERYVALSEENIDTHPTFHGLLNKLTAGVEKISPPVNDNQLTIELGDMTCMERQILIQTSRLIRGGKSEMARVLGISRTTLWKKLKELNIDIPSGGQQANFFRR